MTKTTRGAARRETIAEAERTIAAAIQSLQDGKRQIERSRRLLESIEGVTKPHQDKKSDAPLCW